MIKIPLGNWPDAFWIGKTFPTSIDPPTERTGIPHILHFVYGLWDDGPMPLSARLMLAGWARRHPETEWQIVLWNRATAQDLLQRHYPHFQPLWQSFARKIQRADLLRYLLLDRFGGFYADVDLLCRRSLDGLLIDHPDSDFIACTEQTLSAEQAKEVGQRQPIRNGQPEIPLRVANYFMACRPGHPTLQRILQLVQKRASLPVTDDYDVIYTTGPDVVTEAVHTDLENHPILLLSQTKAQHFFFHQEFGGWRTN